METDATASRSPDPIQISLVGALVAISAVAWLITDGRMAGMDAGPGTDPGALGFYLSTWVVMMAAMMFPSVAPTISVYSMVGRGRRSASIDGGGSATSVPAFLAGYLLVWAGFGLAAYGLFELVRSLEVDALAWDREGPEVAGLVIALAAAYQLSPLKDACLSRCRNPLGFVISSWREGRLGALSMGARHGGWCVGCCWALMAALFAVGVMSLGWMAFFALLIAAEKLLPWGRAANLAIATILLLLAIGVAWKPSDVPGLTLPDSPQATMARGGMEMDSPPDPGEDAGKPMGPMGGQSPDE